MPRAYTEEEILKQFFDHVWSSIDYWNSEGPLSNVEPDLSSRERLEGLTHSLLALLDGRHLFFPAASPVVVPHQEDEAYYEKLGKNYYPPETPLTCLAEQMFGHPWPSNSSSRNPLNKKGTDG
jgi:hypothetical protein